jgi:hypothetical protein
VSGSLASCALAEKAAATMNDKIRVEKFGLIILNHLSIMSFWKNSFEIEDSC